MVRYKNRYFLIKFDFENDKDAREALSGLDAKSLRELLKVAMRTLHGDYGLGCVQHSLNVKYFNMMTRVAIVRCARDHYRNLWSAMTLIKLINNVGGMIVVLHVAGTIRSCQKFLITHNKHQLEKMIRNAKTPSEAKQLQKVCEDTMRTCEVPLRT
ncbi:ribonuclease P/MRP protein subunit POP5-like [Dysidea avara]|uniref:ribonuclease P/MRP protein subunit POP5-like n=1 Tax=Dysidea avara TaxID=196820 RepID=UPI00331FFA75